MHIKKEIKEAYLENKKIFAILIALFIIGIIIGWVLADYIAPTLMPILKEAMLEGKNSMDAFDIMSHNITTSIKIILFSIFFGIFALLSMTVNGFVIGMMGGYTVKSLDSLALFLILIVPHGIFEIPALFSSAASGILLFLFIYRIIRDKYYKHTLNEAFESNKKTLKHAIVLFLVSLVLFVIAGLIEGFVTPQLGNIVNIHLTGKSLF